MKRFLAIALLLAVAPVLGQQPPAPPGPAPAPPSPPAPAPFISLPKTISANVGERLEIKVATAAKAVTWDDFPKGFNADVLDSGTRLLVWADAGKYELRANVYDEANHKIYYAITVVELTRSVPPPPPDPFKADLAKLLAADNSANRVDVLNKLAAIYRQATKFASDASLTTTGQMITAITKTADTMGVPQQSFRPARDRVHTELSASGLPDADIPLTPELRAKAALVYGKAAEVFQESAK